MKTIKTAVLGILLVAGLSAVTYAQGGGAGRGAGGGGRQGGGGRGVAALLAGVADSAAVTEKATEIFTKYATQTTEIRQAASGGAAGGAAAGGGRGAPLDSATMAKITDLNNKRNAEVKALLTKDADKKKFDENVAAQAARGRRGGN